MAKKKKTAFQRAVILVIVGVVFYQIFRMGYPLYELAREIRKFQSQDGKEVVNSPFMGAKVRIAPFVSTYKMSKYGGWKDEYLYLMLGTPKPQGEYGVGVLKNIQRDAQGFIDLKVIEVRLHTPGIGDVDEVCIMENILNPTELFSDECKVLSQMNEVTELYTRAINEIEKYGQILLAEKYGPNSDKQEDDILFKINGFKVRRITTKEKLVEYLVRDRRDGSSYDMIAWKQPVLVSSQQPSSVNELELSRLYIARGSFHTTSPSANKEKSLEEHFKSNELPKEINDWVQTSYPESLRNRWIMRVVAVEMQRMIKHKEISSPDKAEWEIERHKMILSCLGRMFEGDLASAHISRFEDVYVEKTQTQKEWNSIKSLANQGPKHNYGENDCNHVSPPSAYGEGVVVSNSID